jgi:hypothetical protein
MCLGDWNAGQFHTARSLHLLRTDRPLKLLDHGMKLALRRRRQIKSCRHAATALPQTNGPRIAPLKLIPGKQAVGIAVISHSVDPLFSPRQTKGKDIKRNTRLRGSLELQCLRGPLAPRSQKAHMARDGVTAMGDVNRAVPSTGACEQPRAAVRNVEVSLSMPHRRRSPASRWLQSMSCTTSRFLEDNGREYTVSAIYV